MILPLPFLFSIAAPPEGCQMLQSASILARDVAGPIPAFQALPPDFLIGYVPESGAARILRGADLERLAKNRGISLESLPDVCFARNTSVPSEQQIREAMLEALNQEAPSIVPSVLIVSINQTPVPPGKLVFSLSGLQQTPAGSTQVLWRGVSRGADGRETPIWARARITAAMSRVVAVKDLPNRKPIRADQVRLETCEDFPLEHAIARNLDEVVGYLPKMSLRAGAAIRKSELDQPIDVSLGDSVEVDVAMGGARLKLTAKAQSAGSKGALVTVRNLSSGKDFKARVTGKGQVAVDEDVVK